MKRRRTKRRKNVIVSLLLFGFLLVLQGCGAQTSEESVSASNNETTKVIQYGYIGTNTKNLPANAEGWGFHKGIFQEELKQYGIDEVVLTGFPNGPDQTESLISGRLDFGSLGDTPAILAKSVGAETKVITQSTIKNIGYLIGAKAGPKTIHDLEGKTVAIQKGSFMHRYIAGLLKQEGVENVNLIHMLRPDGEAALVRNEVDAMTNTGVNALNLLNEGYTYIDDAENHPDLLGTSVTVVTEDFLAEFPEFPQIWNDIRAKAIEDLKQNEEEYYEFIAELTNSTVELVKEASPISYIQEEPITAEGTLLLEGTKQFLVEEGLATEDFEISEWIYD
ncbi:ABC transporter substrate-binding protein [Halalkalibacter kiskunsagensis]|uniref:ABC transporter substrate-binding protein n=1 Tax=Halalkalibacter kiskunsagensis TaxID=1548599 RepID=A0ABV6KH73_9BACI